MGTGPWNRGRGTTFLSLLSLLDKKDLDELKNPECHIGRFLKVEEYHKVLASFFRERRFSDMLTLVDFIVVETIAKNEPATDNIKIKELKIEYLEMVVEKCYKDYVETENESSYYRKIIQRAVMMLDNLG